MARKRTEKKMGATKPATAEPKLKPVRLDLTAEVHRMLRMAAADEDVSMAAFARDELEKLLRLRFHQKGKGAK